jgi:tetratricopeptide (TPR) repeat protein
LEAFDKALELAPKNAVAWHNKGAILFQQERYAEALPALERAYALGHPSSMAAVAKCRGMLRRRSREQG